MEHLQVKTSLQACLLNVQLETFCTLGIMLLMMQQSEVKNQKKLKSQSQKGKEEVKVRAVEFKILQNTKHTNISSLTTIVQNF
jgi:hypothetical protein